MYIVDKILSNYIRTKKKKHRRKYLQKTACFTILKIILLKNSLVFSFELPVEILQRVLKHKQRCWQPHPYIGDSHCSLQYLPLKPA